MSELKSKHAFGARENIDTAKASGAIDAYDIIYMTNGEIGWLDKDANTVINTPRTQTAIEVNGVTGLGIKDGESVPAGLTLDDVVKMLVQKSVPATYTKPTIALTNNGGQASGNVEAGTSISPKLTATFTQNDAGALSAISILLGANAVAEGATSPLSYNGEAVVIGDETLSYTASATYGDAPVKNDNLGNESTTNWFAGDTITSTAYNIVGKRNLFYGTGVGDLPEITSENVRKLTNKKLAPTQGYNWTINVDIGQQYIMFAYPADLRDVNNVTYVEANDSGMATSFTKTTIDVADARGGTNGLKSYKVYTYKMAVPAAAPMTFKVTI